MLDILPVEIIIYVLSYINYGEAVLARVNKYFYNILGDSNKIDLRTVVQSKPLVGWAINNNCCFNENLTKAAISIGNIKILEWLININCPINIIHVQISIKYNHLDILKYLETIFHKNNVLINYRELLLIAIKNKQLAIFTYIYDKIILVNRDNLNNVILDEASNIGAIDIIKYLITKDIKPDKKHLSIAINNNHVELTKYYFNLFSNLPQNITNTAIKSGNIEILHFFEQKKYKINDDACSLAAEYGKLDMLNWLYNKNYPLNTKTFTNGSLYAVRTGDIKILDWLRIHECPYNLNILDLIINQNTSYILIFIKWLINNSYSISHDYCNRSAIVATKFGDLSYLQWLNDNNLFYNLASIDLYYEACSYGRLNILIWLEQNGLKPDYNVYTKAYSKAYSAGQYDIVDWINPKLF